MMKIYKEYYERTCLIYIYGKGIHILLMVFFLKGTLPFFFFLPILGSVVVQ